MPERLSNPDSFWRIASELATLRQKDPSINWDDPKGPAFTAIDESLRGVPSKDMGSLEGINRQIDNMKLGFGTIDHFRVPDFKDVPFSVGIVMVNKVKE